MAEKPRLQVGNRRPAGGNQNAADRRAAAAANAGTISTETAQFMRPMLRPKREKIQLVGDSTSGKTYAYMRMALAEYELAKREDREPAKFYVIDTDDTMPSFLNEGEEFEHLYFENEGGNVYPFPAFSYDNVRAAANYIMRECSSDDWVIMDTVGRFYEMSQERVALARGKNLTDEAFQRAIAGAGFGAFTGDDWNIVNQVFESVIKQLIGNPKLHKLFTSHMTEVQGDAGRERREVLTMFDQIGFKPRGGPKVPGWMDTVVFLFSVRIHERDERKRIIDSSTARFMTIAKDRGQAGYLRSVYDRDFYWMLQDIRKNKKFKPNVTDIKKANDMLEDALDEMEVADNPTAGIPVQEPQVEDTTDDEVETEETDAVEEETNETTDGS